MWADLHVGYQLTELFFGRDKGDDRWHGARPQLFLNLFSFIFLNIGTWRGCFVWQKILSFNKTKTKRNEKNNLQH